MTPINKFTKKIVVSKNYARYLGPGGGGGGVENLWVIVKGRRDVTFCDRILLFQLWGPKI